MKYKKFIKNTIYIYLSIFYILFSYSSIYNAETPENNTAIKNITAKTQNISPSNEKKKEQTSDLNNSNTSNSTTINKNKTKPNSINKNKTNLNVINQNDTNLNVVNQNNTNENTTTKPETNQNNQEEQKKNDEDTSTKNDTKKSSYIKKNKDKNDTQQLTSQEESVVKANTTSDINLPEVSNEEITPPEPIIPASEQVSEDNNLWKAIISWLLIIVGVTLIIYVIISNRKISGDSDSRYYNAKGGKNIKSNKSGRKTYYKPTRRKH